MTRWWSLAVAEWHLLAVVIAAGVGVLVAAALGMDQVGTWVVCVGAAVLAAAVGLFITRGRSDPTMPEVSLRAWVVVGGPLLLAWWILGAFLGVPTSGGFSAAYMVWFMGGMLLARIISRLASAYAARNKISEDGSAGTTNAQA